MSFVYFMEARGLNTVKIGFAAEPWNRLRKVQSDCPVPVEIVGLVPGGGAREAEMHRLFTAHRQNREWFRFDPPIREYVARLPAWERPSRKMLGGALGRWLHETGQTSVAFAEQVGVSQAAISRFCAGKQIPRRDIMVSMYRLTNGAVTPNDFFDLPELDPVPQGNSMVNAA